MNSALASVRPVRPLHPRHPAGYSLWLLLALAACGDSPPPAGALRVLDVSPADAADALDASVVVRFDKPAVAPEQVGAQLPSPPVTLRPSVPLAAHFSDRQTLVLRPTSPLAPSTRYELVFGAELAAKLGKPPQHAFIARPLRVTSALGIWEDATPPEPMITLQLNTPARPSEVAARCTIDGLPPSMSVALATSDPDEPSTSIALTLAVPGARLTQGQDYTLRCSGITGASGNAPMPEAFSQRFSTYSALALLALEPQGGQPPPDELALRVVTTTPLPPEQLAKHIKLRPSVPAAPYLGFTHDYSNVQPGQHAYVARVNLEAQTDYTLELTAGLVDRYGQKLDQGMTVRFRTADARPSIKVETGIYALETRAAGYPLWTRNVSDLELACAHVPKERIVALLTSSLEYRPWLEGEGAAPDWKALKLKPKTAALSMGQAKNKWTLTEIDLAERCGGGAMGSGSGLYLAELRSQQVLDAIKKRDYGHYPYRVLANRTDLGVLLKVGPNSGLAWVSKLSSAAPASGAVVTLYTPDGKRVFSGATDAKGLLRLPGSAAWLNAKASEPEDEWMYREQRVIALVEHAGDLAVVDGQWRDGLHAWNFGVREDNHRELRRIRGFIQSDRGIYRPGETAHFKGLVREVALGRSPRVPSGERVRVTVEDARGNEVLTKTLALSPFGGFAFDVPLSDMAPLGDWYVKASVAHQVFRESFSVEEVRPVAFEIEAAAAPTLRLHERRKIAFTASYLFGQKLAGGQVAYTIERRPRHLWFPGFEPFTFNSDGANDDFYPWYDESEGYSQVIAQGDLTTDAQGRFSVPLHDPDRKLDSPHDYLVSVSVSDETDQAVSKRVVLPAHSRTHYLGLSLPEWVQVSGKPVALDVVALDPEGKRVAASATLTLKRRVWSCDWGTAAGYRCERNESELSKQELSIAADGSTRHELAFEAVGEVVAEITGKDAQGRPVSAAVSMWLIGDGDVTWGDDSGHRMALVANKQEYAPGETARLVVRANVGGSKLLVTTERDGVRDAFVVEPKTSGEGIAIPIEAAHAPNMFVSVARIAGRSGDQTQQGPQFQLGMIELKVTASDKRLQVALQTEKDSYQPGERVRGSVRVTSGGQPVRAEVALSVADEGVLQLIGFKTPDPFARFYEPFGLSVQSATNWTRIAKLPDPSAEDTEEGADGSSGQADRVRSKFVASALWLPMLVSDAEGRATFDFDAPDNLTAFRMMAAAADVGERFGAGDARITVSKPLLLQPIAPRFLSQGDELEVGAAVRNYTEQAGSVALEVTLKGLATGARKQSVRVAPGESKRVVWKVRAEQVSTAKLKVTAALGEHRDAFELTLPVRRPLVTEHETLVDTQLQAGASYSIHWPAGLDPNESAIELVADRTGLAALGPSLRYLVQYPYGCLEQTLSGFIPLLQLKQLGSSLDLPELRGDKLERFSAAGLAKVLAHQRDDGSFSLWPGGDTYPHLSVYAAHGLLLARQASMRVPERALSRALQAVRDYVSAPESELRPLGQSATLAMAAYVLALAGEPDTGLQARLYDARAGLPLYGRALLLRAHVRAKAPADTIAVLLGETLLALDQPEGWDPYDRFFYMSTKVRDQAIVLSALLDLDPAHPQVAVLTEALKRSRLEGGYWSNTQENAYALMALSQLAERQASGKASVKVLRDGKLLATLRMQGGQPASFRRTLAELPAGELTLEPDGPVYVALRQTMTREASDNPPVERGFSLQRSYIDLVSGQLVDQVKPGQLIKAKLVLRAERPSRFVALVDPLPAGLEPVNMRLQTEQGAVFDRDVPRDWPFSHTELRDDRALAFADALGAHTVTFEHVLRATTAGTFTAPPAFVEAMYEPSRMASTTPAIVRVAP